jgi:tetratricopeptide (TPR) repeat protein
MTTGNIAFKPISRYDVETFRTMALMAKMHNRRQAIREQLMKAVENNPADVDAALSLAVLNFLPSDTEDTLVQKDNIETALVSFDRILKAQPGYWMVHLYRSWLLVSILPLNFCDEEEIQAELDALLALQAQVEYRPYFILPYILSSEFCYNSGDKVRARDFLRQADALPKQAVTTLPDFLSLQFFAFAKKLRMSGDGEMAEMVENLGRAFFPSEYK